MANYDVFNGDADGICALAQWRLAHPADSHLVTGVKRDIALLAQVPDDAEHEVVALDISFDKNRDDVERLLAGGSRVFYCDHHFAGEISEHANLTSVINPAPDVCTALLINGVLKGAYADWAVVGAFGDNLHKSAQALGKTLNLNDEALDLYGRLGVYLNYNGYGPSLEDLYYHPADLYQAVVQCHSPKAFVSEQYSVFNTLAGGYESDMSQAAALVPDMATEDYAIYRLPNAAWARRVSGVFSNSLVEDNPDRAHAILTDLGGDHSLVSVRAPLNRREGADTLVRQFPTGGGRAAAAGINRLAEADVPRFIEALAKIYER